MDGLQRAINDHQSQRHRGEVRERGPCHPVSGGIREIGNSPLRTIRRRRKMWYVGGSRWKQTKACPTAAEREDRVFLSGLWPVRRGMAWFLELYDLIRPVCRSMEFAF